MGQACDVKVWIGDPRARRGSVCDAPNVIACNCHSKCVVHGNKYGGGYGQVWGAHLHPQPLCCIALVRQLAQGGLSVESVGLETGWVWHHHHK